MHIGDTLQYYILDTSNEKFVFKSASSMQIFIYYVCSKSYWVLR